MSGSLLLLVIVLIPALGHGKEADKDELREQLFRPRFEAALAARHYCDALRIGTERFNYVDDPYHINQAKRLERVRWWNQQGERAKAGCAQEQWPARQAQLQADLKQAQDQIALHDGLARLSLQVVAGSWREDGRGIRCLLDVTAKNGSPFPIAGFVFAADAEVKTSLSTTVGPLETPLAPGESRTVTVCADSPSDVAEFATIGREPMAIMRNVPAFPLYPIKVRLTDKRMLDLWNWRHGDDADVRSRAASLAQELKKGPAGK